FFFQAEDGIRDDLVTGVQTCALPICHLIKGGHKLCLHDIKPASKELVEKGAVVCASGKEVAQQADIIITMVPDTPHVQAALFGRSEERRVGKECRSQWWRRREKRNGK